MDTVFVGNSFFSLEVWLEHTCWVSLYIEGNNS